MNKKNEHPSMPFLKSLYQHCNEGEINLRFLPSARNYFIPLSQIASIPDILEDYNLENSFFGIATRSDGNGTKDGIIQIPAVWVDLDFKDMGEDGVEEIRKHHREFPLQSSFVIESGGGAHVYWVLKEPAASQDIIRLEAILKRLAAYFKGDRAATDASRILRIPGSTNHKYDPPRAVAIKVSRPENQYNLDDFNFLPEIDESHTAEGKNPPNGWEHELLGGVEEGARNNAIAKLAGRYIGKGLSRDEILPILLDANSRYKPPLGKDEVSKTLDSILRTHSRNGEKNVENLNCSLGDLGAMVTLPPELKLTYPTSHLKNFDHLLEALGLFGNEYILIAKACWYALVGQTSKEVVNFGQIETDLRFPVAFILPSGHGKLNITSLIEEVGQGIGDHVSKPTSYHPEQLIGKVLRKDTNKETKFFQVKGHFDSDIVIFDDGIDLIQSKDPVYKESRRYLCGCLDVIGKNLMTKKPVDVPKEQALKYYPKCSVILFFQPFPLPEESFLSGVFRRFIIIYLNFGERDYTNEYAQRLEEAVSDDHLKELTSYLNEVRHRKDNPLTFSDGLKESFKKYHLLLSYFGRTFGIKASNFTRITGFTLQNWLLKMSVILARSELRTEVAEWDIERAFVDFLEMLDSTFQFVERKVQGKLDYSESWSGATGYNQLILEWLALMGATSEDKSNVTIDDYQKKIQDVMGYSESGARKRYQRHKKKGWIDSNQRQQTTRVWLKFKPPVECDDLLDDLGVPVPLAYQEIVEKIESERKMGRGIGTPYHPGHPEDRGH